LPRHSLSRPLPRAPRRTPGGSDIGGRPRFPGTREWVAPSAPFCLSGCTTHYGFTEVGRRQKVKGKSRKWVLNASRHHRGGQKAKGKRQKWEVGAQRLAASQRWASFAFYLLPFAFQGVASVRNPRSKIENPKSCVGPSAILTVSGTRPSDCDSNARFGPVEDRRNKLYASARGW